MKSRHEESHASLLRHDGENFVLLEVGSKVVQRGKRAVFVPADRLELTPLAAEMLLYDLHSISQTLRGMEKPAKGGRMRKAVRALRGR